MKFISWNVNGLRACLKKGFEDVFNALDADFFCIQETKMQPGQADFAPAGYTEYIYSADKKGYSGTAIWAKTPALSVRYGLDEDVHNHEGRAITLEYPDFYLVNLYVPNSQNELARIDYRMQWEDDLRRYLQKLDAEKPVILCGDLNVAHEDIDLKNPGPNRGAAGFSDQERGKLGELLRDLPKSFLQCHKSYAVNSARIISFTSRSVTLTGGVRLPVSRGFSQEFSRRLVALKGFGG